MRVIRAISSGMLSRSTARVSERWSKSAEGLSLLQALADLDSIGKHDFASLLFDPINLSRDNKRRTFSAGFIHFDSRLFNSFNFSIRRRASDGESSP